MKDWEPQGKDRLLLLAIVVVLLSNTMPQMSASTPQPATSQWNAPASARNVKNPVPCTPQSLQEASQVFQDTCSSCHGTGGAGDGVLSRTLNPKPANFTDAKRMNRNTDGDLFWKITHGRGPMPAWEQLPAKQRWGLVHYIRTFAPKANSAAKPHPK
jgi:mono/diheme cytochrome c family protein